MGKFTVGQVVLVESPHSDLKGGKKRPALVLAVAEFDNVILCQITSRSYTSKIAIKISVVDFLSGGLPTASYVRPDKLFTADIILIEGIVGELNVKTKDLIFKKVRELFK